MKKKSLKTLTTKLDAVFSKYIRLRDADGRGNCRCVTCDAVKPVKEMHCGHFVSRVHKALRWDERNCSAQCPACNLFHEGRKDVYAVRLIEKYGPHILHEFYLQKQKPYKITAVEMEEMIADYQIKLAEFEELETA